VTSKRLVLAGAGVVLIASSAVGGAAAASEPVPLRGGDPLQRLRTEELRDPASPLVPQPAARRTASHSAGLIWLALASGSMLIIVLSAIHAKRPARLARARPQSPEGGVQMRNKRKKRDNHRQVRSEARDAAQAGEAAESASEGTDGGKDEHPNSFADLGQHVASVLETARQAAERIEADARQEATLVVERSQAEAAQTLAEARQKAEELDANSARTQSEANATAEEFRARAEAYAEEKRQEADEAAAELLVRTERQARERSRAAEERQQALDVNVERTEERLRKLVIGLRELAGRLDVLVGSDALVDLAGPEYEAPQPGSLDEALNRQVAEADRSDAIPSMAEPSGQET
jgi:hypothetical protein